MLIVDYIFQPLQLFTKQPKQQIEKLPTTTSEEYLVDTSSGSVVSIFTPTDTWMGVTKATKVIAAKVTHCQ